MNRPRGGGIVLGCLLALPLWIVLGSLVVAVRACRTEYRPLVTQPRGNP